MAETLAAFGPGQSMEGFELDVTVTTCAMLASATRDFYPVHHDRDFALAAGAPDLFVNVLYQQALFGRLVTDCGGTDARLVRLKFRLEDMVVVGDRLRCFGVVTEVRQEGGESLVDADVFVETSRGRATSGNVTFVLGSARS